MEDILTKRSGEVDEPHRHNSYTVLIVNKARGLHKIDLNTYDLSDQQIFFVAPGRCTELLKLKNRLDLQ
ncbi:hypothetical protein POV26_02525 [Aequorivita todarodis]|uniref:hypothetical protein n=1 Tax=Aequorivita todarodis TaxID=2036821 RepID=UPI0023510256|nr:hypothetical protein [Aequorivita todarodis]MDC7999900.1 hypothetical protein [Aequorivita todarodis]